MDIYMFIKEGTMGASNPSAPCGNNPARICGRNGMI